MSGDKMAAFDSPYHFRWIGDVGMEANFFLSRRRVITMLYDLTNVDPDNRKDKGKQNEMNLVYWKATLSE